MKIFFFISLISSLIISSCKKDGISNASTDILGKWSFKAYDVKYYTQSQQLIYDDIASASKLQSDGYIIFNKDGTCSFNSGASTRNYTISGNSLICGPEDYMHFTIVNISKSSLTIQSSYQQEQTFHVGNAFVNSYYALSSGTYSK